jgi:hypothetical protein
VQRRDWRRNGAWKRLKERHRERHTQTEKEAPWKRSRGRHRPQTKLLALSHTLCVCCQKNPPLERERVRVLGCFRATSVRAGRSVCATARVVLLLATLVPEPSQRRMKEGRNEGRKEVGCEREGGTGRDGTCGQTAGRTPFLSFPFDSRGLF